MAIYRIDNNSPDLPAGFELEPRDLYRSHGFEGGEMFWETSEWLAGHERLVVDAHDLLAAVVENLLLPGLTPAPLVAHVGGLYNPVRAVSREGDLLDRSRAPEAWPEVVVARRSDVLDLAHELARPKSDWDRTEWADRWDRDAA